MFNRKKKKTGIQTPELRSKVPMPPIKPTRPNPNYVPPASVKPQYTTPPPIPANNIKDSYCQHKYVSAFWLAPQNI